MKRTKRGAEHFFEDIKPFLYGKSLIYVDVGAFHGDVLRIMIDSGLKISEAHLIEPNPGSYKILENLAQDFSTVPRFNTYNVALGSRTGSVTMRLAGDMTKVIKQQSSDTSSNNENIIEIECKTLDQISKNFTGNRVSLLKLDVEGFELDVLKGAKDLLTNQKVDVIYVEAGMDASGTQQCYYRDIEDLLTNYGYRLFRVYEQVHEWMDDSPFLRRANMAFMSSYFAEKHPFRVTRELFSTRKKLTNETMKREKLQTELEKTKEALENQNIEFKALLKDKIEMQEIIRQKNSELEETLKEIDNIKGNMVLEIERVKNENETTIAHLKSTLSEAKADYADSIKQLKSKLTLAEKESNKAKRDINLLKNSALKSKKEFSETNRNLRKQLLQHRKDAKDNARYAIALERKIKLVLASRTWRLMGPVRVMTRIIKRLVLRRRISPTTLPNKPKSLERDIADGSGEARRQKSHAEKKSRKSIAVTRSQTKTRSSIESPLKKLEDKLWGGFSTQAIEDLNAVKSDPKQPSKHRSEAAFSLARWYTVIGEHKKAYFEVTEMRNIHPRSARQHKQFMTESLLLTNLGRQEEARSLLMNKSKSFNPHIELMLANTWNRQWPGNDTPDSELKVLAHLNNIYRHFGLTTISKRNENKPLSIDNLKGDGCKSRQHEDTQLVSVIVPAHNASNTIETVLTSLAEQSWEDLEIIVVDDASTDDTAEIVADFCSRDPRFRLIRQKNNSGGYTCRNLALKKANGTLITIHDSDDWSHPDKIEQQILRFDERMFSYNYSFWVRATDDLLFTGPIRPSNSLILKNDSSALFVTETVRELGGWDSRVRTGADVEFIWRLKRYNNELIENIRRKNVLRDCPLSLGRERTNSLTRLSKTHVKTIWHGVRREYRESAAWWHGNKTLPGDNKTLNSRNLNFPIPAATSSKLNRSQELDCLFIGDFNMVGGTYNSSINMLQAAIHCGLKCGLIHYPRYDLNVAAPLNDRTRTFAWENKIQIIVAGDQVRSKCVIVTHPPILNYIMDRFPKVEHSRLFVVVNQMAERDVKKLDIAYNPARVRQNLIKLLGHEGEWIPISNHVRRIMSEDPRYPRPYKDNWTPLINLENWIQPTREWRGHYRKRPAIGRHGRDHILKWPGEKNALWSAYCAGCPCEVRFLGGAKHAKNILNKWPENWHVYPFGSVDVQEFLSDLDFFVHYPNQHYIEEFGRAPMEAMAIGVPVILPPVFRETFGDAAIYAEPHDVWPTISKLWNDESAYQARVKAGQEFVDNNCNWDQFIKRLDRPQDDLHPCGVAKNPQEPSRSEIEYSSKTCGDHVIFSAINPPLNSAISGRQHRPVSFSRLYVCMDDNRAKSILRKNGETQPCITRLWRHAVARMDPDTVLDIGANYGEIGLGTLYSNGARIFLFEPNIHLIPYLERSVLSHKNSENISIVNAAVGNTKGKTQIYYDRKWSGTSSISRMPKDRQYKGKGEFVVERKETEVVVIDDIIKLKNMAPNKLLFKIDVEGYEWKVLEGMVETLRSCTFIGIVEVTNFNDDSFNEVINTLSHNGHIYDSSDLRKVKSFVRENRDQYSRDLVFSNDPDTIRKLRKSLTSS